MHKIPATGSLPARNVECGMMLAFRRQTAFFSKGSGTSGMIDHLKRKHPTVHRDIQERSRSSDATKRKFAEIYSAGEC